MPKSLASSPLTRAQLLLGFDCMLKLRYAREGLRQRHSLEYVGADFPQGLCEALYWSCFPEDVDARGGATRSVHRHARAVLSRAVQAVHSGQRPQRIRGLMLRAGNVEVRIGLLVVHRDRWEVAEIRPRTLCEEAELLMTRAVRTVRADWRPYVADVAVSVEVVRRWLARHGSAIGVKDSVAVTGALVGLPPRKAGPTEDVAADAELAAFRRTLDEFSLGVDGRGEWEFRTRCGSPSEGRHQFVHLTIDHCLEPGRMRYDGVHGTQEPVMDARAAIDRSEALSSSGQWPSAQQCISMKCKHCEFRVPGDPDSGFSRCWGAEVDHQQDHILQLERLSEDQLHTAVAEHGLQARISSLTGEQIHGSQEAAFRSCGSGAIYLDEPLQAWIRQCAHGENAGGSASEAEPAGLMHFLSVSTAAVPIAAWPGAPPYAHVPFAFAVHRLPIGATSLNARIPMQGFVRCDLADPRRAFVEALRAQLGDSGPVYHWSSFERAVVTALANWLSTARQPDDCELHAFLLGLLGQPEAPGRLVDLGRVARGFRPPEHGWQSRSLGSLLRYAWKHQRISAAFCSGHKAKRDPTTYDDPIDPVRSLPTVDALWHSGTDQPRKALSAADPSAPMRLWLECRLGGRDPERIHALLREWGHLRSASVLIAYHFLAHIAPMLAAQPADRTVRIFVSSTFRDFREERDLLKRKVEPTLRRRSLDRHVDTTIVDLRWGITDEQASRGMTLPVCLKEVERCRPYFVGLLGHRYGWVPPADTYPSDLVERMPWLSEHAGGSSMTELEIRHGVLREALRDARFYFRAYAYSAGKGADFESTDPVERQKLEKLKQLIRERGLHIFEDYPDPATFADSMIDDIWGRIDRMFPADLVGDAGLPDWAAHRAHSLRLMRSYVGDPDEIRGVQGLLADARTARIAIVGPPGCGKSALFANALRPYGESAHAVLVQHFVGVGSTPATAIDVARRMIRTVAARLGVDADNPRIQDVMSADSLCALGEWARASDLRLIMAIDGVDQVGDASMIGWLRAPPPKGVVMVVTARVARVLPSLRTRQRFSRRMRVRPLSGARARGLVEAVLAEHGRNLTSQQLDSIVTHRHAGNPAFLRTVIDELIACPTHERLPERLRDCVAARSPVGLYGIVLRRLSDEIGHAGVRTVLGVLADAPGGITEAAAVDAAKGMHAELSALRLQLGHALVDAGGRIAIRPGPFAEAVLRMLAAPA
jgi:hypothetical protein